jgi:hypothetical protein
MCLKQTTPLSMQHSNIELKTKHTFINAAQSAILSLKQNTPLAVQHSQQN